MTPERYAKIVSVLSRRQLDLTLVADRVSKPQNLSAILRTCDAVGIHEVHWGLAVNHHQPIFRRTASGSGNWLNLKLYESAKEPAKALKRQGYQLVAAHFSEDAQHYQQVDYTQPTALVLGAELDGVSSPLANLADVHVTVPMVGMVASLNVSVATAIILTEAMNQRLRSGQYDHPQLTPEEMNHFVFEWGYPDLANYCKTHQVPYPKLDDQGHIIYTPEWKQLIQHAQSN